MSYTIHCTKKLLERVKPEAIAASGALGTTLLGNWYATVVFWKPQVALLVNEKTLLPVFMPLVPAKNLATRFPAYLADVLEAHGVPQQFIDHELAQMNEVQCAKTSNRSVVGIMNQFPYLAEGDRAFLESNDLLTLSISLSETPFSPLYQSAGSPDRELQLLISSKNFAR
ncbi:DUF6933 domain-containing protein [Ottowia thiooxydans]|uniref:DUF6933 domain-containing protein n=1 Tax=Ottowia thiooxydans TaxID=219182 RepID=UPI00040018DC|nr:hypothetical protein [Ottowia thiooxydans]